MNHSEASQDERPGRVSILGRLLYTLLFLIVFEILRLIIQVTALAQYVCLLIARAPSEPLRAFGDRLSAYAYRVMRYITLNDNQRPYPFTELPEPLEPPVEKPSFD